MIFTDKRGIVNRLDITHKIANTIYVNNDYYNAIFRGFHFANKKSILCTSGEAVAWSYNPSSQKLTEYQLKKNDKIYIYQEYFGYYKEPDTHFDLIYFMDEDYSPDYGRRNYAKIITDLKMKKKISLAVMSLSDRNQKNFDNKNACKNKC